MHPRAEDRQPPPAAAGVVDAQLDRPLREEGPDSVACQYLAEIVDRPDRIACRSGGIGCDARDPTAPAGWISSVAQR